MRHREQYAVLAGACRYADLQIDLDWLLSYPVIGEPLTDAVLTPYRTSLS
jgi:hypothetical protein